jgi:hypothetical protein
MRLKERFGTGTGSAWERNVERVTLMKIAAVVVVLALGVSGCGDSPTASTTPTRIIGLSGNLAFGSVPVGSSVSRTLTISNSGNATLTVGLILPMMANTITLAGPITVAAGGTVTSTVIFSPQLLQAYSGTLTVTSDATSGTNTLPMSGTGTP